MIYLGAEAAARAPPFVLYDSSRDRRRGSWHLVLILLVVLLSAGGGVAAWHAYDRQSSSGASQPSPPADPGPLAGPASPSPSSARLKPTSPPTSKPTVRPKPSPASTAWIPKGYDEWDSTLAWKWTDEDCGNDSGYCWTLRVKSRYGCPKALVGKISIAKKDEEPLATRTDAVRVLAAGRTALLTFAYAPTGKGTLFGRVTDLTCT